MSTYMMCVLACRFSDSVVCVCVFLAGVCGQGERGESEAGAEGD